MNGNISCPICENGSTKIVASYDAAPSGETPFKIDNYYRQYCRCGRCGHCTSVTDIDLESLYAGDYVEATYSKKGVAEAFDRVMALAPERSDNTQRVARIAEFVGGSAKSVLDVGSGLGVFPARMKEEGWNVTALDPDPRAAAFISDHIGIPTVAADFMSAQDLGTYDLITFNKVLEHVSDPVDMLTHSRSLLNPGGVVYVELPDAEGAALDPDNFHREEFFIEHLHVFSFSSFSLLALRAGFQVDLIQRIREPSGKYTLFGFLTTNTNNN